jgi:hypothetical protein
MLLQASGSGNRAAYIYAVALTSSNLPTGAGTLKPALSGVEDGYLAKFVNDAVSTVSYIGTART